MINCNSVHAQRHAPEVSFFVERVTYGHLDYFQVVAWSSELDRVLRRYNRKQSVRRSRHNPSGFIHGSHVAVLALAYITS